MRPSTSSRLKRPGRLEEGRGEGAQGVADVLQLHVLGEGRRGRRHGVLDVDADASLHGGRDLLGQEQAGVAPVLDQGDHLAVPRRAQHDRLAPLAQVVADDRVLLVHREEDDLAAGHPRHLDGLGVVGVEDAGAVGQDRLRHDLPSPGPARRAVLMPFSPRWSLETLVTTATSQRSKPRPERRMPPRAVSSTA